MAVCGARVGTTMVSSGMGRQPRGSVSWRWCHPVSVAPWCRRVVYSHSCHRYHIHGKPRICPFIGYTCIRTITLTLCLTSPKPSIPHPHLIFPTLSLHHTCTHSHSHQQIPAPAPTTTNIPTPTAPHTPVNILTPSHPPSPATSSRTYTYPPSHTSILHTHILTHPRTPA